VPSICSSSEKRKFIAINISSIARKAARERGKGKREGKSSLPRKRGEFCCVQSALKVAARREEGAAFAIPSPKKKTSLLRRALKVNQVYQMSVGEKGGERGESCIFLCFSRESARLHVRCARSRRDPGPFDGGKKEKKTKKKILSIPNTKKKGVKVSEESSFPYRAIWGGAEGSESPLAKKGKKGGEGCSTMEKKT